MASSPTPALAALATLLISLGQLPSAQAAAAQPTLVADPASVVNTFIGTSNAADDFPGADTPFGMVQWSPDTPSRPDGGGYEYNDTSITGFSLTHIAGPGCGAMGDVPFLPTTGAVNGSATAPFSHANEQADAGYYKVKLNSGITTELTTTTRSGMGRFTFPATKQANLLIKLAGSQTSVSNTTVTVVSNTEVVGSVTTGHFCGASPTYTVYFAAKFDHPFTTSGGFSALNSGPAPDTARPGAPAQPRTASPQLAGPSGEYLTFDTTADQVVQAKVGVSYVSTANAQGNRDTENPQWDFDSVHQAAHAAWNSMLGRIAIAGGTVAQQQTFYSALYHSLLHPNVFSDVNGQYIGFDNKVHSVAAGHAQYANFSGWDIYRSQAQLSALLAPDKVSDIAQSMVNDYSQSGMLPKWSLNNGETYVMVGDPGTAILADYYAFGARDFDTATALTAMVHEASVQNNIRPGQNYMTTPGYLPANGQWNCCNFYGPVSTQLEYDTADFALSAFAGALGDTANQTRFANRAQEWANVFNTSSKFMQPRQADGSWTGGFSATSGSNFVEGTSWQYTGMVPFNIHGLATAFGGNAAYVSYLNSVLSGFDGAGGSKSDLGNEPSIELPWEYDYVGQPYRAQQVIRQVQDQIWTDKPNGLAGNDDLGTMSAWYVWSALGMFPETPGTADLALGSPMFTQAVVTLPGGHTLTVNAPQAADNAPYVQSLSLNGSTWNNAFLPPSIVNTGGTLDYVLGTTANTSWAASSPPPSYPGTGAPYVKTGPITSALAGKCVDDNHSGLGNNTAIQLYDCNGTNAQRWAAPGDGTLQVMGKCMDVVNSGTANGVKVQLYDCNGTGAQQWQVRGAGLVNPQSGRCLDDPNSTTTNGTQLQIYDCNNSVAQSWTLP
ncbi:lectin [Kutzneria kofuensis]|uniref:Putative alpha-1,2-mannosidase n=1 Tax=Kutzneria kofuensis TaxID=103725 RepID=A0A7W9KD52_9PSEU|nr:lectin [Kutzneria kofuensis]MBB5890398.1 putative alpha-1,2-mannosidase [Kutzneria kofuensis]